MQAVDERPETVHVYVVPEKEPHPTHLPIALSTLYLCALFILCTFVSSTGQPQVQTTIRVVAVFPPLQIFSASVNIIPTGVKTYPATYAYGVLTLTNGSVVSQELPSGLVFAGSNGAEVITVSGVFIPAGSALGYGYATVKAQAVTSGRQGNIPALSINGVFGSALYIRNLSAFTGGRDAYSVKVITVKDRQNAMSAASASVTQQEARRNGYLAYPCSESVQQHNSRVTLLWACQYFIFTVPKYMHITALKLVGKHVLVNVWYVARSPVYRPIRK